jgi:hypothetical protein
MHAVTNRPWIFGLAACAALSTLGCRGSRPFGSMVKVTQESESATPEIDPPEQRLAVSKPRATPTPSDSTTSATGNVAQTGATQPSDQSITNRSSRTNRAAKRRISTIQSKSSEPSKDGVADAVEKNIKAAKTRLTKKRDSSLPTSEQLKDIELPTGDAEELMVEFKDYPPEVQRAALRRLVAATARSAERSDQPESIIAKLRDRATDLPNLPDASAGDPNAPPPKRIGTVQTRSSSIDSAATPTSSTRSDRSKPAPSRASELETDDMRPKIAEATQRSETKEALAAEVKQAVVSSDVDESTIAQASVEHDLDGPPIATSLAEIESESIEPPLQLTSDELFGQLVQQLATAADDESDADRASRLIKLRHLMVLSGDPDGAVEQIDGMSETEQEYLRHQLLGLWTMIDPQGHPVASRRFSSAISQIREAAKFAAAATDSLDVRSLAFCTEIESYGQIKPFKNNRFDAGQQVILYCEIENFTANDTEEGFETHLQGSYDLFNENDEKVVSQLLPADQQVSANYLRDYFIAYQMHLPEQLRKGKYRLQLTMEDVNGKKYGQSSIQLEIKK